MKNQWNLVPLNMLCTPRQWPTISQKELAPSGYPVYGANGVIGYYSKTNHESPTVMITCRGATCGTLNVSTGPCYITGNAMSLDDVNENQLDIRFLYHALLYRGLKDSITGSAQPQITRTSLEGVSIPLPPLEEQKRIAAILDRADALRRKRAEALRLTDDFLQSVFLDMFGDPVTNPKGWPMETIDTICRLVRGSSPRPKGDPRFYNGTVPRLMVADVTRDGCFVTPKIDSLTEAGAKLSRPVPSGTIVMAVSGDVGVASCLMVDACVHDGFVAFTTLNTKKIHPIYLMLTLNLLKSTHDQRRAGAIFQNLTTTDIKAMEIPCPALAQQEKFVSIFQKQLELSRGLKVSLASITDLFHALTHRAFRGEL